MLNTVTRVNHASFETLIFDDHDLAYGRGVTAHNSRRAARAVLARLKLHILAALTAHEDTASGIAARLGKDRKSIARLLLILTAENEVVSEDCPVNGVVYKRSESAK